MIKMDSVQTQIVFGLQIDGGLLSGLLVQLVLGLQLVWGGRVGGTEVPLSSDCRFWRGLTEQELKLRQRKMKIKHRVFYFWDTGKKDCLPCTRCQTRGLVTLLPCQYFRDSVCVKSSDWSRHIWQKEISEYQDYSSGLEDSIDEAVLVYSAAPDSQISDHTEVWGEEQREAGLRTDSPSRRLARTDPRGQRTKNVISEEFSDYGKPSFYSESESSVENSVERPRTPFVDVIREFLEKNISRSNEKYIPLSTQSTHIEYKQPVLYSRAVQYKPAVPLVPTDRTLYTLKTTQDTRTFFKTRSRRPQIKTTVQQTTILNTTPVYIEKQYSTARPVRKYIEVPSKQQLGTRNQKTFDRESRSGLWRVEEDYDDKNDEFGITHQQIENTTRSAGERAFEEIRHLIQLEEQDPDLKPLQLTLLLSSVLAGTLLLVLIGVIGWNKYKSSQFKILNNADTTYHNMSPFPTSFPLERGQEESRIGEGESTVAPAVARSLKNIRQESTESRSTLQSCVVDERGRTILKV